MTPSKRQETAESGLELLKRLLDENTELTKRIDALTSDIHGRVIATPGA